VESAVYDYLVVLVIILVLGDSGAAAGMLLHVCNASVTHLRVLLITKLSACFRTHTDEIFQRVVEELGRDDSLRLCSGTWSSASVIPQWAAERHHPKPGRSRHDDVKASTFCTLSEGFSSSTELVTLTYLLNIFMLLLMLERHYVIMLSVHLCVRVYMCK